MKKIREALKEAGEKTKDSLVIERLKPQIQAARREGYSYKSIWSTLHDDGTLNGTYRNFLMKTRQWNA